jgi:hypothetical protein
MPSPPRAGLPPSPAAPRDPPPPARVWLRRLTLGGSYLAECAPPANAGTECLKITCPGSTGIDDSSHRAVATSTEESYQPSRMSCLAPIALQPVAGPRRPFDELSPPCASRASTDPANTLLSPPTCTRNGFRLDLVPGQHDGERPLGGTGIAETTTIISATEAMAHACRPKRWVVRKARNDAHTPRCYE